MAFATRIRRLATAGVVSVLSTVAATPALAISDTGTTGAHDITAETVLISDPARDLFLTAHDLDDQVWFEPLGDGPPLPDHQDWILEPVRDATEPDVVRIVSATRGGCLEIDTTGGSASGPVYRRTCDRATEEHWQLRDAGDGAVTIVNVAGGGCLQPAEIWGGQYPPMRHESCAGADVQRFRIIERL
ncbi:MAG TPA: RICIN domain-containing protein [Actinopolymorphaceae bacterium]